MITAPPQVMVRSIDPEDAAECANILFGAHQATAALHGFPPEVPSIEFAITLIRAKLASPHAHGFLAEDHGQIAGSVFLNVFPGTPVAAIGPLSVDPAAPGGVGRHLMEGVLEKSRELGYQAVRLVQSPSHLRSLALYTKCGFALREPLVLMHGPVGSLTSTEPHRVRPATSSDIDACNRLANWAHGFARESDLVQAIDQGTANVAEHSGRIVAYSTAIGFRGHAAAETTGALAALIHASPGIHAPGFFVPVRNTELLGLLFDGGLRALWPAALMTCGPWQEPRGAYLPSIAF